MRLRGKSQEENGGTQIIIARVRAISIYRTQIHLFDLCYLKTYVQFIFHSIYVD